MTAHFPWKFFLLMFAGGLAAVAAIISPIWIGRFCSHSLGFALASLLAVALSVALFRTSLAPSTRLIGFAGVALELAIAWSEFEARVHG